MSRRWTISSEFNLNLVQSFALRLDNHTEHEKDAYRTNYGENPECNVDAKTRSQVAKELGDDKCHKPIEETGAAAGNALNLVGEYLAHHHPGDGSEAQGENDDEYTYGHQSQPIYRFDVLLLQVKVQSKGKRC